MAARPREAGRRELAVERVASLRSHDAWLAALRAGDAEQLASRYAPAALVAMRHPITADIVCLEGRDAVAGYYRELLSDTTVLAVDVVTRLVDRWFVFSELAVRLAHADACEVVAKLADVCVLTRDDAIAVHLGTSAGPAA
ncbi:MAG: nuclear transport factor 2 family protein [Acidimicrobiia bacterium]